MFDGLFVICCVFLRWNYFNCMWSNDIVFANQAKNRFAYTQQQKTSESWRMTRRIRWTSWKLTGQQNCSVSLFNCEVVKA